jgi:hypothetical protein
MWKEGRLGELEDNTVQKAFNVTLNDTKSQNETMS